MLSIHSAGKFRVRKSNHAWLITRLKQLPVKSFNETLQLKVVVIAICVLLPVY